MINEFLTNFTLTNLLIMKRLEQERWGDAANQKNKPVPCCYDILPSWQCHEDFGDANLTLSLWLSDSCADPICNFCKEESYCIDIKFDIVTNTSSASRYWCELGRSFSGILSSLHRSALMQKAFCGVKTLSRALYRTWALVGYQIITETRGDPVEELTLQSQFTHTLVEVTTLTN